MSSTLEIVRGGTRQNFTWDTAEEREQAKAAFNDAKANGASLAFTVDAPGASTQVTSFEEIEKVEKERGTVTVRQTAPLIGG